MINNGRDTDGFILKLALYNGRFVDIVTSIFFYHVIVALIVGFLVMFSYEMSLVNYSTDTASYVQCNLVTKYFDKLIQNL